MAKSKKSRAYYHNDTGLTEEEMLEKHTPLVYTVLNRSVDGFYVDKLTEFDDMQQIGMIGLLKAIRKFDPGKEVLFATFAAACIRNELWMYLRKAQARSGPSASYLYEEIDVSKSHAEGDVVERINYIDNYDGRAAYAEVDLCDAIRRTNFNELMTKSERKVLRYIIDHGCNDRQADIGDALGFTQSYTSRTMKMVRLKVKKAISGDVKPSKMISGENSVTRRFSMDQINEAYANGLGKLLTPAERKFADLVIAHNGIVSQDTAILNLGVSNNYSYRLACRFEEKVQRILRAKTISA